MVISDDFSDAIIAANWSVTGPLGAQEFNTTTDGVLQLATADGDYDAWNTITAARAMQAAVDEDLTLTARFLSQPTQKFQMQGFLIAQGADDWLRFDTYSDGNRLYAFAAITVGGVSSPAFQVAIPGDVAPYLRVTRSGDLWSFSYSLDGAAWVSAGSFTHAMNVSSAGLFAGSVGSDSAFTAQVDYFETAADPIIDEDAVILPPNAPPVAVTDHFAVAHDDAITFSQAQILANDTDADGDTLSILSISAPAHGILIDNGDGTYTYTPTAGYSGTDPLSYVLSDGTDTVAGEIVLTVADAPVSADDPFSDDFDDADLDPLWSALGAGVDAVMMATSASEAWLSLTANGVQDIWGSNNASRIMQDSLDSDLVLETRFLSDPTERYEMQGLLVEQDADTWLRFDIFSDGDEVYAFAASTVNGVSTERIRVEISGGTAPYLRVTRTDDQWTLLHSVDGQNWTTAGSFIQSIAVAEVGVFAGNAGDSTSYTAQIDYFETSLAPLRAEDPGVVPVNLAPEASDDAILVPFDTPLTFSAAVLLANDSDPEGDPITLILMGAASQGTLNDNGDGTYTYTPAAGFSGHDNFTYTLSDGVNETIGSVAVTVAPAPGTATGQSDDFASGTLSPIWTLQGPDSAAISFDQAGADGWIAIAANGAQDIWGTNNASRVMQAHDDVNFVLETRFLSTPIERYQMQGLLIEEDADTWLRFDTYSDGGSLYAFAAYNTGVSSAARIQVEIPGGSAPFLKVGRSGDSWSFLYSLDGQTWVSAGSFTQSMTVSQVGVFAGNTGSSTGFTAAVDYFETSQAPLSDEDGSIIPGDLIPVAQDDYYTLEPDGTLSVDVMSGVLSNDTDHDGAGLILSVLTDALYGVVTLNGDGSFSYAANVGYDGPDSFTYQITDQSGQHDTATVTLASGNVTPAVSDDFAAPVLGPEWLVAGPAGVSAEVAVVGQDGALLLHTADGNFDAWDQNTTARAMQSVMDTDFTLEARFLSTPSQGNEMQGFLVTQDTNNWVRLDVYTDGTKLYAFGASTINGDSTIQFRQEIDPAQAEYLRLARSGDVWRLETSANGTLWAIAGSFAHAMAASSAGLFAGNVGGSDGFTAVVDYFQNNASPITDEDGSVVIPYSEPIAVADILSAQVNTALIFNANDALLANDTDADGETISLVALDPPQHGTLIQNGDGTYTYQPLAGFSGNDSFTYQISDGTTQVTGTATVAVKPPAISDDFSGGPLAPEWVFYGITGSAQIATTATEGFLQLHSAPGVSVSASDQLTTPRLMQEQPDVDFSISAGFLTEPESQYQEHGLLIQQDDENWIRFDLAYTNGHLSLIVGVIAGGETTYPLFTTVPSGNVSDFRITRVGDIFTFETSADGVNWTARYTLDHGIVVSQVGLFAGSTSDTSAVLGYTAFVDYFQNNADPIIAEDGALTPTNVAPIAADDTLVLAQDQVTLISIVGLLSNDADSNGDTVLFDGFTEPLHGTLTDNEDGTLTYTPNAGFVGMDSFVYSATDGLLADPATVSLFVGNPIDVWYGETQTFGAQGQAQEWINVLGNVQGDVDMLSYTLNGGAARILSVGADTRRLQNEGDFNIDLAYSALDGSSVDDIITITAVMSDGRSVTREVVIDYEVGPTWDANYHIDWETVTNIQDVVQVADGVWDIADGGVRPVELGYDRLLVFGDHTWDNYELSLTVTTHDLINADPNGRDGNGFAIGMLWGGHTDTPVSGWQPKAGWEPGAAFFYTDNDGDGVGQLNLHPSRSFFDELAQAPLDLDEGATYNIVMRVEQVGLYDRQYSIRIWADGATEPVGWTMQGVQTYALTDMPATGSLYLNAHYMDVSFNDLTVTEITGRDIMRGLDTDDVLSAVDTGASLPGLGEVDVFVGDDGADTFVLGDAMGAYYDDGQAGTLGEADYAYIWDFVTGVDHIQLAGSAANYTLLVDMAGLQPGTAILRSDGELIGLAGNVYGLDLGSDDFIFADTIA
ncbi:cadherin-like domain-containing protein [Loktanella agnita]|uniref:cadherin-like domain-containing protein n=1 Tax=Loktanella agnita TaxID=287097 RepID=UPI0039878A37